MAARQEPKYRLIMRTIEERIASGCYPPGTAIPAERALAREFGTNNETVNKAISNLVASGTLYRRRGIGTFVSSVAPAERRRIDILAYKRADELFQASSFHEEIMFGLQNELAARGTLSRIVPVRDLPDFEGYLADTDALIASRFLPLRLLRAVTGRSIPLVCLNFEYEAPRTSCLVIDNSALDVLVDHLAGLGHRKIAFVMSEGFNGYHESRRVRFMRAMELYELEENIRHVYTIDPEDENAWGRLLHELGGCTAVMAADDVLAVRLRSVLLRFGRRVPEDVSLTGYGNLSLTKKIYPDLTTTDIDRDLFCTAIVEEAVGLLEGSRTGGVRHFRGEAIIRSSTGPAR